MSLRNYIRVFRTCFFIGIKLGNLCFNGGKDQHKEDVFVSQKEHGASLEMPFALSDTASSKVQEIRRVKIEFTAGEEVAKLIERAKELLRHKYPQGKLEDLVREAFELLLEKKDPERKIKRISEKEKSNDVKSETRYIPQVLQREIYQRDEGQCSYASPEGRRCGEKNFLEMDHVRPWSLGGNTNAENLRLLCRTHNQWRAEKTFDFIRPSYL